MCQSFVLVLALFGFGGSASATPYWFAECNMGKKIHPPYWRGPTRDNRDDAYRDMQIHRMANPSHRVHVDDGDTDKPPQPVHK